MSQPALGIDVAKKSFVAALRQEKKYLSRQFVNRPKGFAQLQAWLAKQASGSVHACLEATGIYGQDLAVFLHQTGHRVSVVNPARIAAYARSMLKRTKTDSADARLIAHFCHTQQPETWTPPTAEQQELQALVRRLRTLEQIRQEENNRLEASTGMAWLKASLRRHLRSLEKEIGALRQRLQKHVQAHPELRQQRDLLCSIQGIGDWTALCLLAELPPLPNFQSARQVAAYAGLSPHQRQSGTSQRGKAHLSKLGNPVIRKLLYMPALTALRWNPLVRALGQRLSKKGKHSLVVIAAAMRKLLHLVYGVIHSGQTFDPAYRRGAVASVLS